MVMEIDRSDYNKGRELDNDSTTGAVTIGFTQVENFELQPLREVKYSEPKFAFKVVNDHGEMIVGSEWRISDLDHFIDALEQFRNSL